MTFPLYNFSDRGNGYTIATVASDDTAITLGIGEGAGFSASNMIVFCQSECMIVTTRSSDTLSGITRGAYGTTAVAHGKSERIYEKFGTGHYGYQQGQYSANVLYGDQTVYASIYISGDYEIPSGLTVEIFSGANVEIG